MSVTHTKKTLFFLASLFIVAVALIGTGSAHGDGGSLSGWAWSGSVSDPVAIGNIGWISLSGATYGLAIDEMDITGYAWSSNVGWIDFAPKGPYPTSEANHGAKIQSDGTVTGWARILSIAQASTDISILESGNSGGWEGWISLSGGAYGITFDDTTHTLSGYAWSPEIGWLDFGQLTPMSGGGTCASGEDDDEDGILNQNDPDCAQPLIASCSGDSPSSIPESGGDVTVEWTAVAIGGTSSYSYDWTAIEAKSESGDGTAIYSTTYDSLGVKSVTVQVDDTDGNSDSYTCSIKIIQDGEIIEIPPFF